MSAGGSASDQVGKPKLLSLEVGDIPQGLRAIPRWLLWRYIKKKKPDGTIFWAKVPFQANGIPASTTNPKTWCSYEDAFNAWAIGDFDGVGIVLGADVQGIDLDDCRDPNTGELNEFAIEVLERVSGYAEVSPSGTGIKIFAKTNLDRSRTNKEVGVELYRDGRYFTVTGHCLGEKHSRLADEVQALDWLIERVWGEATSGLVMTGDAADLQFALYRAPLNGWDADKVRDEITPYIDLEMHYEDWIMVGQALYHQFDGDEEGFELWEEMFQDSSKYGGESYDRDRWKSFKSQRSSGRGPVTLASVIKMVKGRHDAAKRLERDQVLSETLLTIEGTLDARELQDQVAARVANTSVFSDVEREQIAAAIQSRGKMLGVNLPIATVRSWVRNQTNRGISSTPDWARGWVYVTEGDKFLSLGTKQEVTPMGFRALYNREMPVNQYGSRERADICALEQWDMEVVTHKAYMPGSGETFEMFGLKWVNLYRPDSVPEMPEILSHAEIKAIDIVKKHFEIYLADPRERALLLSVCAHNVQHPGQKIRWAPYVHGVPGDGKSFFSELMAVAMGGQNVRILNGSTLESNFTDWAIGSALVVIEEMKQHGRNRHDIMNRVKPMITNSSIDVHPKGKASYTAPNVSNYIIFSNYLDGAPVDAGDRRYMFLSSELTTEAAEQMTKEGYFKRLFDAIHKHPGAIRKWLLSVEIHSEFDPNGRAPDTIVKKTVIEMSKSDFEAAAEDLIEKGAEGVCSDVISSAHFTRAFSHLEEVPSTTRVNTMLTQLGFRFAIRKKWRGEACRLWVKQGVVLNNQQMMEKLYRTLDFDFMK